MSQVAIVLDVPSFVAADAGSFIGVAEEAARLAQAQFPVGLVSVDSITKSNSKIIGATDTVSVVFGGAAGDITVPGVTSGSTIKSVHELQFKPTLTIGTVAGDVATTHLTATGCLAGDVFEVLSSISDSTQAGQNLIGVATITPGTDYFSLDISTASKHLVYAFHGADTILAADLTAEFTAGTGKINNTNGTDTTGKQLVVVWA